MRFFGERKPSTTLTSTRERELGGPEKEKGRISKEGKKRGALLKERKETTSASRSGVVLEQHKGLACYAR